MRRDRYLEKVHADALDMIRELFAQYDFDKIYNILGEEINSDKADKFYKDRETVVLDIEGSPLFYVSILRSGDKEFRPFGLKLVDRVNFVTIHLEYDQYFEHICFISNVRGSKDCLNIYNLNTLESKGVSVQRINDIINMMDTLVTGIEKEYPEIKS